MVEILNTLILGAFTAGLLLSVIALVKRFVDYGKEGVRPPLLAYRDLGLLAGLCLPFLLIFIFRAFGLTQIAVGQIWWTLITGIPPVLGVAQFVWFEYFVIEKGDSRGYIKYMMSQDQQEDLQFGMERRELEAKHNRERQEDDGS